MAVVDVAYRKGWNDGRQELIDAGNKHVSELIGQAIYLRQPYEDKPWFFEQCDKTVPGAIAFYPRSAVVAIQQQAVAVGHDVGYRLAKGTDNE